MHTTHPTIPSAADLHCPEADICIVVEGGYPYLHGGVATWVHSFLQSFPDRTFHVMALRAEVTAPTFRYKLPPNVVGFTDAVLDHPSAGRPATNKDTNDILAWCDNFRKVIDRRDPSAFAQANQIVARTGLGVDALLESRVAWRGMEQAYRSIAPAGPLIDFFWTWRNFAVGMIALARAPLPRAKLYHATSTGYAGLVGIRAKQTTRSPFVLTEHGIYTNERRMDLATAKWIFDSGVAGYDASNSLPNIRGLWQAAFRAFSSIAYDAANCITTQYVDNQIFQRSDGAPQSKQVIIPNGIDVTELAKIEPDLKPRRPTILFLGRVVGIKDVRTYILAAGLLRETVPDVEALIIGPQDDEPAYAEEMRSLVIQEGLQDCVKFLGRVPDVKEYFAKADIMVLTSLSEAQPLALLEAGAAGLPAVTTDVGSCREIIEGLPTDKNREHGGIVVPACDPKAAADALSTMLLDPTRRKAMAKAMRARVIDYYNKDRVDGLYANLYKSMFDDNQIIRQGTRST